MLGDPIMFSYYITISASGNKCGAFPDIKVSYLILFKGKT